MPIMTFESRDSIPSEFHSAVEEKDGKFTVNLSLTSKVNEFRDNNLALSQERDDLKAKNKVLMEVVGDDLDEFREELTNLRDTQTQVNDGKLTKKADIEQELTNRTENMRKKHADELAQKDAKITELSSKNEGLTTEIKQGAIARAVQDAINAKDSGIHTTAAADLTARAMGIFTVEGGDIVSRNGDGAIQYGEDGTSPLSVSEWANSLRETSPHFFKSSNGGGATGGEHKVGGKMSAEEWSKLSPRQKLEHANAQP